MDYKKLINKGSSASHVPRALLPSHLPAPCFQLHGEWNLRNFSSSQHCAIATKSSAGGSRLAGCRGSAHPAGESPGPGPGSRRGSSGFWIPDPSALAHRLLWLPRWLLTKQHVHINSVQNTFCWKLVFCQGPADGSLPLPVSSPKYISWTGCYAIFICWDLTVNI